MFDPDPEDNLKIRRNLALMSAIYAGLLWPHELIFLHVAFDLNLDLIKALLVYVATMAGTSIGGYLWAILKIILFLGSFGAVVAGGLYIRHVIIENHDMKQSIETYKANLAKVEETRKLREEAITTESAKELDRERRKNDVERKVENAPTGAIWPVLIDGLYGNP